MDSKPYRIIFMGTPEFAVPSLQALLAGPDRVVAVVTQPDRPRGRGRKLTPPPVKTLAQSAGIPVLQPASVRTPEFLAELKGYAPDLIAVTAFGRILPGPLLHLPPHGTLNVHGSLLPRYRGAAPIQWAILNGDQTTGVTIMQMDEGLDTGAMLLSQSLAITPEDTAASLAVRMAALGGELLCQALVKLHRGELSAIPQNDDQATAAPPLSKEQGLVDWTLPAEVLGCRVRGLDPWPTAFTFLHGLRLRLFAPLVLAGDSLEPPGAILRADQRGLLVATGRNQLLLKEIQLEGGKRLTLETFLRGRELPVGTVLGS
ncbi:MAG: methionyl-tRNA formyltransferase [Desulfobulbaceae bacterium]|nr:methionyl-tRNA formyltransferase [Desulfobulbaceae bacterium]